ncbi:hypothetical protein [Nicoliella lavandulae]|uniref:Uncharacterized protein n=1 Tax=Nicoliella lavandulae TaxID=3082954 RepID=A0ABU8SM25_9LACO
MNSKLKLTGQYLLNLIINFLACWLIVYFLRTNLPISMTNGDTPEIPPTRIADLILVIVLAAFIIFFSWVFNANVRSTMNGLKNRSLILKLLNWIGVFLSIIVATGISMVVNDGSFSDLMSNLLSINQLYTLAMVVINLMMALWTNHFNWYRWGIYYQLLLLILFWLGLWISPA